MGQPSTQYLQAVQPTSSTRDIASTTFSIAAFSSSLKGSKFLNVFMLSAIWSSVDMPLKIVATPGRLATQRKSHEAMDLSGIVEICELAALAGFHDDDRDIPLRQDLIELA